MDQATLKRLPNHLTIARLIMCVPFFALLHFGRETPALFHIAMYVFILAGLTDIVDGYIARKYDALTTLGRVLDPAADKILTMGAFLFFIPMGVAPWMVIVMVARELTVNALRGTAESLGHKFPASVYGKAKMAVQSFTIGYTCFYLSHWTESAPATLIWRILLYVTVLLVVISGLHNIVRCIAFIRSVEATQAPADDAPESDTGTPSS